MGGRVTGRLGDGRVAKRRGLHEDWGSGLQAGAEKTLETVGVICENFGRFIEKIERQAREHRTDQAFVNEYLAGVGARRPPIRGEIFSGRVCPDFSATTCGMLPDFLHLASMRTESISASHFLASLSSHINLARPPALARLHSLPHSSPLSLP